MYNSFFAIFANKREKWKSAPFQPNSNINPYLPLGAQREQGINWTLIGFFQEKRNHLRVLEATVAHALVSWHDQQHRVPECLSPVPSSFCPTPVKCSPTLFSRATGSFGTKAVSERKLLLCCLGHFSPVLLALLLRGSDMSGSFPINWPLRHIPQLRLWLVTCLFPPRPNVLCAFIFQWTKRDLIKDPQPKKPSPSWKLKPFSQILDVFQKN